MKASIDRPLRTGLAVLALCCLGLYAPACDSRSSESTSPAPSDRVLPVRVDPRVELFSTIHRLAGTGQYDERFLPGYIEEVEQYFAPFKDHRAARLAIELRDSHDLDGNSPMALAVYLTDPPALVERAPLIPPPDDLDRRWTADVIPHFLEAAREFAHDSDFMAFFEAHSALYDRAVTNLRSTLKGVDPAFWFEEYFGERPDNYTIIIGMQNGDCNYGSSVTLEDGSREFISIMGATRPDARGAPRYPRGVIPIVAHEFCHSFVNPLVDRHTELLREAGEALFPRLREKLRRWGYNHWFVMMYEYLVRACVIRYVHHTQGERAAENQIAEDEWAGFSGIKGLAALLAEYEKVREAYPDLESFLPRIAAYFDKLAGGSI